MHCRFLTHTLVHVQAGRRAMGLEPYPESVIFCDLLDGAQATGTSSQGAESHDCVVSKAAEDTGVSKHHGYSEADLQARRRLFEQCQALIFEDSEPVGARTSIECSAPVQEPHK